MRWGRTVSNLERAVDMLYAGRGRKDFMRAVFVTTGSFVAGTVAAYRLPERIVKLNGHALPSASSQPAA
jgi:hypothetical protein